jgi:hypothetical protein
MWKPSYEEEKVPSAWWVLTTRASNFRWQRSPRCPEEPWKERIFARSGREIMMFGYTCPMCGKGVVQETTMKDFTVRFLNGEEEASEQFTVPEASVGICDACGEQCFDAKEYKRWKELYESGE